MKLRAAFYAAYVVNKVLYSNDARCNAHYYILRSKIHLEFPAFRLFGPGEEERTKMTKKMGSSERMADRCF